MKKILSFLIFIAVIAGAFSLAPVIGQKLDKPYEAGRLHAPAIELHHSATEGEGHEAPAENHG